MPDTIREAAEALGLKSYDTALPQWWVDRAANNTGIYPAGKVVWCYDGGGYTGYPVALCEEGRRLLGDLALYAVWGQKGG